MPSRDTDPKATGKTHGGAPPLLEWISGGIGLAIAIGTLAFLGTRAVSQGDETPVLSVSVDRIVETPAGYTVTITVRNASHATAVEVQVEGTLTEGGREMRKSSATIDYVPGRSQRRAGLLFDVPPSESTLDVRVTGYTDP